MILPRRNFLKALGSSLFLPAAGIVCAQDIVPVRRRRGVAVVYSAKTLDWASRVVSNGGAMPSGTTLAAADTWHLANVSDGTDTLMINFNFVAPDSLIAAFTPFYKTAGFDPWTTAGTTPFILSDLSVNGVAGASGKAANTGIIPANGDISAFDFSFICYLATSANETGAESGDFTGSDGYDLQNYQDVTYFDSPFNSGTGRISISNPSWSGYQCATRTANNAAAIYEANSGHAHAALVTSSATVTDARSACGTGYLFWAIHGLGGAASYITRTISACGIAKGMTSGQSANFYTRLQALRVALGGGFV